MTDVRYQNSISGSSGTSPLDYHIGEYSHFSTNGKQEMNKLFVNICKKSTGVTLRHQVRD